MIWRAAGLKQSKSRSSGGMIMSEGFWGSQFIDVIEYVDESNKMLVSKFERRGDEIKQGAKLIVRNGQCAVFVFQGRIADIFAPGSYKLNTGNLPVLSSLAALPYKFNSPIKSDVYFVNTTQFINNRWGTKNPILMRDPDFNVVRVTAFGTHAFQITDVNRFMTQVFGARKLNMTYDILSFLNSFVSESVSAAIAQSKLPVLDLATSYREFSKTVLDYANQKAANLGFRFTDLAIENISLPQEVERLIDEQSGVGIASKNMDRFVQYQTARAMREASNKDGGLAALGASFAFGRQMADTVGQASAKEENKVEKLREYKKLLDEGVISEVEFTEIKKKLLDL